MSQRHRMGRGAVRCRTCGRRFTLTVDVKACGAHPGAETIPWHSGADEHQALRIAYWVICSVSHRGEDLDAYVANPPPGDLAGTNRAALEEALILARRWQNEEEFFEGRLPPVYTKGLFG